jgi:hypothetical protein
VSGGLARRGAGLASRGANFLGWVAGGRRVGSLRGLACGVAAGSAARRVPSGRRFVGAVRPGVAAGGSSCPWAAAGAAAVGPRLKLLPAAAVRCRIGRVSAGSPPAVEAIARAAGTPTARRARTSPARRLGGRGRAGARSGTDVRRSRTTSGRSARASSASSGSTSTSSGLIGEAGRGEGIRPSSAS